jgi:hypothetical protein
VIVHPLEAPSGTKCNNVVEESEIVKKFMMGIKVVENVR